MWGREDVGREREEVNGDLPVQLKDMRGTGETTANDRDRPGIPPLQCGMVFGLSVLKVGRVEAGGRPSREPANIESCRQEPGSDMGLTCSDQGPGRCRGSSVDKW